MRIKPGHVTRIWEISNAYRSSVVHLEEENELREIICEELNWLAVVSSSCSALGLS